jgi:hypothetical protein
MKNIMDKIQLIKSAVIVAEFWGVTPSELVGFVGFFAKPEKKDKWNEIAREVQEFYKLPLDDRAKKAGFKISKPTTK